MIEKFIRDNKSWNVVEKLNLPSRKGQYFPVEDIPLSDALRLPQRPGKTVRAIL